MPTKATKVTFISKSTSLLTNDNVLKVEKCFKEYSEHTAIQGFQYLAENRTKTEKLFWAFIMLCSLTGGTFMAAQLWSKYQQSPKFVSFETSPTSTSDIPFPAITICPESKFSNFHFTNYSEYLRQLSTGKDFSVESLSLEEMFWSIILICSLCGCAFMVAQLWSKYQRAPVFVSFETRQTPINDIPFPAVTICPESKFNNYLYGNLSVYLRKMLNEEDEEGFQIDDFRSLPLEQQNQIFSLLLICDILNEYSEDYSKYIDNRFYQILEEIQTPFENSAFGCMWSNNYYNCSTLFTPVLTSEGICYSFNVLDKSEMFPGKILPFYSYYNVSKKSDWDIDQGFGTNILEAYPKRALLSGEKYGLTIFLTATQKELEQTCKAAQEGYRVSLHNPLDIPSPSTHYFHIPFDQIVTATVKPKLTLTSENVKGYSPSKRKCYFSKERPLKYFNVYTLLNCELECMTDFVLEKCGCVPYSMPRMENTKICGVGSQPCVDRVYEQYKLEELRLRMSRSGTKCECKSACTELSYDVELSQSAYSLDKSGHLLAVIDPKQFGEKANIALLSIYFKSDQFLAYKRRELYGTSDLISNIGGLMSLFTGFSMISLVEIIYFLTLRIYYNIKLYGHWSGPKFYA